MAKFDIYFVFIKSALGTILAVSGNGELLCNDTQQYKNNTMKFKSYNLEKFVFNRMLESFSYD